MGFDHVSEATALVTTRKSGWNMSINFLNGVAGKLFRDLEMTRHEMIRNDTKHYDMT